NTIRMVGGSIGTVVIISVMSTFTKSSNYIDPANALLEGIHAAFIIAGMMVLVGLLISLSLNKKSKQRQMAQ
ncbi:MFS transporter, partial [Cytobacillus firmus]|nr:hypothetical protein [Cytobacillus firmus]MBG9601530.1 hypothetical protein [Cytobacillus firmus]MED1943242.1 MFS transporter [Cytobacillus firmus]